VTDRFRWIPASALVEAHAEQIAEHGGAEGIRDQGLLEAATYRPRQIFAYESDATVFRLAAALAYGIVQNHPFVDGNKRVGFLAAFAFLNLNGWYLDAAEKDAEEQTLALAAKQIDEHAFAVWLEACSVRL